MVEALLGCDSWLEIFIIENVEFSFVGLPLFLLLEGGAISASSVAISASLSSVSDSKGSVDALERVTDVPLFGLPVVSGVDSVFSIILESN